MLNDLYFKTTCNIRPYFLGSMGGFKIEGPLYFKKTCNIRPHCLCPMGGLTTGRSVLVTVPVVPVF